MPNAIFEFQTTPKNAKSMKFGIENDNLATPLQPSFSDPGGMPPHLRICFVNFGTLFFLRFYVNTTNTKLCDVNVSKTMEVRLHAMKHQVRLQLKGRGE